MPQTLNQSGDSQCEGQRDLQLLSNAFLDAPDDGGQTREYEQQHADKLCSHCPPKRPAFYFCHLRVECVRCVKPTCMSFCIYSEEVCVQRGGEEEVKQEKGWLQGTHLSIREELLMAEKIFYWLQIKHYTVVISTRLRPWPSIFDILEEGLANAIFHCRATAEQDLCLYANVLISGHQQRIIQESCHHTAAHRSCPVHLKNKRTGHPFQ